MLCSSFLKQIGQWRRKYIPKKQSARIISTEKYPLIRDTMSDQHIHDENEALENEIPEVDESTEETSDSASAPQSDDEYAALLDKYQRLQAEFINYKNRTEQEKREFFTFAGKGLILSLLPTADSLQSALKTIPEDLTNHPWIAGFHQFSKQFQNFLASQEVSVMDIIPGETAFDPELHEAIASEPTDGKDGVILENYQDGYLLKGKVLRNAKVKVGM